jgi:RNA polymerase sigma-70 factor (ECF subfamily)
MDVMAPDVVVIADGGGVAKAALRPVRGDTLVAKLLAQFARRAPDARVGVRWVNGAPALWIEDPVGGLTVVSLAVVGGRITQIFAMRNPHKLGWLDEAIALSR